MERLTYKHDAGSGPQWQVKGMDNLVCSDVCREQEGNGCVGCPIARAIDRLAYYEDLEEKGLLVILTPKNGKGKTCGDCALWKRDPKTVSGGTCPIPTRPKFGGFGGTGPKYKSRGTTACRKFVEKEQKVESGECGVPQPITGEALLADD